jgi:ribokinase
MGKPTRTILLSVGSVYVETNYLALETNGAASLELGHEYRSAHYEIRPAGSALNMAIAAKALGTDVAILGKIGKDEMGARFLSLLSETGISDEFIVKDDTVQTSVDTGLVLSHNGQNIQVVSGSANQSLSARDIALDLPIFDRVNVAYFGGFFKQDHLFRDYPILMESLQNRGIKTFFDHGRVPVTADAADRIRVVKKTLAYVDGYFPNEAELLAVTGKTSVTEGLSEALRLGASFVAVKQGEKGSTVADKHGTLSVAAPKVTAVSTVAAGDAYNAAFIVEYMNGKTLGECASFANRVASYKVAKNKFPFRKDIV